MPDFPSPRAGAAMAFHRASAEVVLFGGGDRASLGDTWTWDGERWQQEHPAHQPPARQHAAMAYDAERRHVLLFGGDSEDGSGRPVLRADTWAWDGSDWTQLHPVSSPNAGPTPHMAYDGTAREVVLVTQPENWSLTDAASATRTWTWDGQAWTSRGTKRRPILEGSSHVGAAGETFDRPMHGSTGPDGLTTAMATDPASGRAVLVQRIQHHNTVPGPTATWTWTGDDWWLAPVHDAPAAPPTNPLLAADDTGQRVLYIDISARLWAWDGANWTAVAEGPEPLHRGGASMAIDRRGQLILFGGAAAPPGGLYSDTWTWSARVGWSRRAGPAEPTPVVRPPVVPPPKGITAEHAMRLAAEYIGARSQNATSVRPVAGRARDFWHPGSGSPGGDRYVWAVLCTGTFIPGAQPPLTSAAVLLDYVTGEFVRSMIPAPPQLTER